MRVSGSKTINDVNAQKTNNTSSQRLSSLSYNYLSALPRSRILQIIKEGELMGKAPEKFNLIWKSIRKTDLITGGSPNLTIFESIFEDHKSTVVKPSSLLENNKFFQFMEILKLQNASDVFEVFALNQNGELNEDSQILIFSTVKEKMQKTADELVKIQEYDRFKQLMEKIRKFEKMITNYQNELRQNIYKEQLETYHGIGEDKLNEFYDRYNRLFKEFHQRKHEKMQALQQKHSEEKTTLDEKMHQPIEILKVKPNNKIKEYQNQEKLLSIVERVEEAYNIRRELRELEVKEKELVDKKIEKKNYNQMKILLLRHTNEEKLLLGKLQEEENKLIVRMRKDFTNLQKQINIHEREIKRIQNLVTKYANFRGFFLGELKREKVRSEQQNDIMAKSKNVTAIEKCLSPQIKTKAQMEKKEQTPKIRKSELMMRKSISKINNMLFITQNQRMSNIKNLKILTESNNIVKFYLKQKFGADLPVNYVMDQGEMGDTSFKLKKHEEIEKYLIGKKKSKKEIIPQLSELYDQNLCETQVN